MRQGWGKKGHLCHRYARAQLRATVHRVIMSDCLDRLANVMDVALPQTPHHLKRHERLQAWQSPKDTLKQSQRSSHHGMSELGLAGLRCTGKEGARSKLKGCQSGPCTLNSGMTFPACGG
jgi:hypothetical protein